MDAPQALADLTEVSSQIEAAAIVDADGAVMASTVADPARAKALGDLVGTLLAAAGGIGTGTAELVQLEAASSDGSVFVVRDGERAIVAVTQPQPTVGLVFYDLKSALRSSAPAEGGTA